MSTHGAARIPLLINDLVIRADRCNLRCEYCLAVESPFRRSTPLRSEPEVEATLRGFAQVFDAPILKLSGGEAFLLAGLVPLVEAALQSYESVQILTNGTRLAAPALRRLAATGGVFLQVSLDGHRLAMNRLRVASLDRHRRLLANLDRAVDAGLPVQIFCVLHRDNAADIADFADYLRERFAGEVSLVPFPVRGAAGARFAALPSQRAGLDRLIDEPRHRAILPPPAYLLALREVMFAGGPRRLACAVPALMLQCFEDGVVTPCPYSWLEELGNLAHRPEEVAAAFGQTAGYRVRGQAPPRAPFCRSCITDAYPLSLFFAGAIDLATLLTNQPILSRPRARARLQELQQRWPERSRRAEETHGFRDPRRCP
jgi:MoaA/NifB/PqqE/SkfB family radical SAM enzyme